MICNNIKIFYIIINSCMIQLCDHQLSFILVIEIWVSSYGLLLVSSRNIVSLWQNFLYLISSRNSVSFWFSIKKYKNIKIFSTIVVWFLIYIILKSEFLLIVFCKYLLGTMYHFDKTTFNVFQYIKISSTINSYTTQSCDHQLSFPIYTIILINYLRRFL